MKVTYNRYVAAYGRMLGVKVTLRPASDGQGNVEFVLETDRDISAEYWASMFPAYVTALRSIEHQLRELRRGRDG